MRRDVEAHLAALLEGFVAQHGGDPVEAAGEQVLLELPGAEMRFGGAVRGLPRLTEEGLPFPLERFRIAGAGPELRLFEVDAFDAELDDRAEFLHQVLGEAERRDHVRDVGALTVQDRRSVARGLRVGPVVGAVPPSIQIVLIVAPGDAGHQVDAIAGLAPPGDALRRGVVEAVDHHEIGAQVDRFVVRRLLLEAGRLGVLVGVAVRHTPFPFPRLPSTLAGPVRRAPV